MTKIKRALYALFYQPHVIWRHGEPSGARVVYGGLAAMWHEFWIGLPIGRVNSMAVTELTLAGIMPMQVALAFEEMAAILKGENA